MGAPGCGKGTQAAQIVDYFDFVHLSTGELFREKYAQKGEKNKEGKALIDKGGFFSDEIAFKIIQDFISENKDAKGIIYDGFPRDIVQADYFLTNICANPIVIELKADEEKLIRRLLRRGMKKHRKDDSSDTIIYRRMELYQKRTYPVVELFAEKNLLYTFQSEGDIENVANPIRELLIKVQKDKNR